MRFLLGWTFKLGFLGLISFGITSGASIKLPDEVLGYKVPNTAQQWVDRNAQIGQYGQQTESAFKSIAAGFDRR